MNVTIYPRDVLLAVLTAILVVIIATWPEATMLDKAAISLIIGSTMGLPAAYYFRLL